MIKKVFLICFVLVFSLMPVFAQEQEKTKKYDFTFSLNGGNISGQFTLATNFLYAQQFGVGFFQIAGFANLNGNIKEYGSSIGLGVNSDKEGSLYLFADSLYSYGRTWFQLRPTLKLQLSWLGLMGFYAYPLNKSTIQIGDENVGAAKYWGGEAEIVPVNWARIYGNIIRVESAYNKYRVGAEVRLLKFISLSADWNRTDTGLYSNWTNYQDFRISLNVLFGAQQKSFKLDYRNQVAPLYPILTKMSPENPDRKDSDILEFMYERVLPVIAPSESDPRWIQLYNPKSNPILLNTFNWRSYGPNKWIAERELCYNPYYQYAIYTLDLKVTGVYRHVARKIYVRIKGTSDWIELTRIRPFHDPDLKDGSEQAEFLFDSKGIHPEF